MFVHVDSGSDVSCILMEHVRALKLEEQINGTEKSIKTVHSVKD